MSCHEINDLSASPDTVSWQRINFQEARKRVKKLQRRIAAAYYHNDDKKVEILQNKMIHSYYAKALAVKQVTSTRGRKTPGVDQVIWNTPEEKSQGISELYRRGYHPQPLRRVTITCINGKVRPLGIPTIRDRAMQTLYQFTLSPIAEATGDASSFAYRSGRSARGAVHQCLLNLTQQDDPLWILKCDIKSCFDRISHEWLLEHIPMDREMLRRFLKCGYIEQGRFYPTVRGIPQGGCLSSVFCNMTLDGLEPLIKQTFGPSVHLVRYADDFIVTGAESSKLVYSVLPVLKEFLAERGLTLSKEKTQLLHLSQSFSFLGVHVYLDGTRLLCEPTSQSVERLKANLWRCLMRGHTLQSSQAKSIIRGWTNYYQGMVTPGSLYKVKQELQAMSLQLQSPTQNTGFITRF